MGPGKPYARSFPKLERGNSVTSQAYSMKNTAWLVGKKANKWKCAESTPLLAIRTEPLIDGVLVIETPADPTLEEEWIF